MYQGANVTALPPDGQHRLIEPTRRPFGRISTPSSANLHADELKLIAALSPIHARRYCINGVDQKSETINSWPIILSNLNRLQFFFAGRFLGKFAVN